MIRLQTIEAPVVGEFGKVFSTAPDVAIGEDGKTYFIKGRNNATAFSEVAGCRLSALLGIDVPRAGVGAFCGDLYAAVETVPKPNRNVRPWLGNLQKIENDGLLFEIIAVDTWLVNDDRNMGNLVGSSVGNGRIRLFMIDFEKSRALKENPFMGSGNVDPQNLWPTAELGQILRGTKPTQCPAAILAKIRAISSKQISDILRPLADELPFVHWHESSIEVLTKRAEQIDRLVESVWTRN